MDLLQRLFPRHEPRTIIQPDNVHEVIGQHMLADGLPIVLSLRQSHGRDLVDARTGRTYLDMFSCFATWPVGINHPRMWDREFIEQLTMAALTNPTNSDIYTVEMAGFVATWSRLAMPSYLPHLFLISGGALAVENALKAAFDWKIRRNARKGHTKEYGHQVIHFGGAFHGRSGYTLSLTNTADPWKHKYFPKFNWPRVWFTPALRFPVDEEELERVKVEEQKAISQIESIFRVRGDDVACIIIEPIQGEGGDNHLRPEFLRRLRELANEHDVLLIFDEIQTGMGLTGAMWAHQHFDVQPDILVFGKKTQVCGIMAGPKLDLEPENVFRKSSRINSTWGGNLADMVRCQRFLEIIEQEKLIENAATVGGYLRGALQRLQALYPDKLSNARGRGLMCAIDLPDQQTRDLAIDRAFQAGMLVLPCGTQSIRFRPPLDLTIKEVNRAADIFETAIKTV